MKLKMIFWVPLFDIPYINSILKENNLVRTRIMKMKLKHVIIGTMIKQKDYTYLFKHMNIVFYYLTMIEYIYQQMVLPMKLTQPLTIQHLIVQR